MLLLSSASVRAQSEIAAPIHWAYGPYLGTGYYEIGADEEIYVLSMRASWRWREASIDAQGDRAIGVQLRMPVAVGLHQFEPESATFQFDNVGTVSAVPGVEIEIPITPRWSLKPLAYLGWGTEIDGDASAWIYWTGIKSRWRFHSGAADWALINSLTYVGYSSNDAAHGNILPLFTGVEVSHPLGMKKIADKQVHLHWHIGYTDYLNELEFTDLDLQHIDVAEEWEVGAAFGTGEDRLRLWRLTWDRVGVAYRFSNDGDFEGVTLFFSSLFDR